MDIDKHRWNKSVTFILPLLYPTLTYKDVIYDNFINCFIGDTNQPTLQNSLIIEYDNDVATFKILSEFKEDYKKIILGQYSQLSDKSKNIILSFWKENSDSLLYSVLYKTQKIIDNYWNIKKNNQLFNITEDKEYWPKLDDIKEIRGFR